MLVVLALDDVAMICNLLVMEIVGGHETLVSPMKAQGQPHQPDWLNHAT